MLSDSKSTLLTAICGVPNILFTEFMPCVSIACLTCGSEKSGEKITVGIAKFFSSSAFVYVPFTPSRALITRSFAPVIAFSAQVFFSSAMFTMTERSTYLSLSSFATTKAWHFFPHLFLDSTHCPEKISAAACACFSSVMPFAALSANSMRYFSSSSSRQITFWSVSVLAVPSALRIAP